MKNEYKELSKLFSQFNIAAEKLEGTYKLFQESLEHINLLYGFDSLIGKTKRMQEIYKIIQAIAKSRASVLIYGESGTGKELVARAIHRESDRKEKPFISINCAAMPENLLESELFGHEKGAFTGAIGRKGKFELADKGTLLLDEISEMSMNLQAKLLRVLQEFKFYRVGGNEEIEVDVRIIATTNRNPKEAIQSGKLRSDLYYRLNVVSIELPPLRERKEDIPLLAIYFLKKYSLYYNKKVNSISPEGMKILLSYDWPGNVRELENVIERAVILTPLTYITPSHIELSDSTQNIKPENLVGLPLNEVEKILIKEALKRENGNKTKVANLLGITTKTLRNKIKEYKIE